MKQVILTNGDTLVMRKAIGTYAGDLLEYLDAISEESDFLTFGRGEFIMTIEQEEKFLDHVYKQSNSIYIIALLVGKIVGTLIFLGGSRPRTAHAGELGVNVLKEYWGNGIGKELIKYLIKWCKQSLIIRKINLKVRIDNFSAIHLYKKMGFTEEGIITRELLINDRFYDVLFIGYEVD